MYTAVRLPLRRGTEGRSHALHTPNGLHSGELRGYHRLRCRAFVGLGGAGAPARPTVGCSWG